MNGFQEVSSLIRNRKSTYAYSFSNEVIPKEIIEEIVTNAIWAPTHKLTQPWRFEVLEGAHKEGLGKYICLLYTSPSPRD